MKAITVLIEMYLNAMSGSWKASTLKSEGNRLRQYANTLTGDPSALWSLLERNGIGRYTRITIFNRVTHFWSWCNTEGYRTGNTYKKYMALNANQFKQSEHYERKYPGLTYTQAKSLVETIKNEQVRKAALSLLTAGLRSCELKSVRDPQIKGKGGKLRPNYVHISFRPSQDVPYHQVYKALKRLGLKPHDLRKICATKLGREGMKESDLLNTFGWSTFETAKFYLAPLEQERLADIIHGKDRPNESKQILETVSVPQSTGNRKAS